MLWGCRVLTRALGDTLAHDHFYLIGGQSGPVNYRQAQTGFNRKQWTQSFGYYMAQLSGSDLASVVRVGVEERVQST